MSSPPRLLAGHMLVADLELSDPSFSKSVVLLLDHSAEGAFGLIVNRPLGLTAAQIVPATDEEVLFPERRGKIPLYSGGPVETQAVFAMHSGLPEEWRSDAAREVQPGLWFEPSFLALQPYVSGASRELPPDDRPFVRLYLGYAGWGPGQLEGELKEGVWQIVPARPALVFQVPPQDIWPKAMELKGGFWAIVAQTGVKPSLN